jgi:hypothetical protein
VADVIWTPSWGTDGTDPKKYLAPLIGLNAFHTLPNPKYELKCHGKKGADHLISELFCLSILYLSHNLIIQLNSSFPQPIFLCVHIVHLCIQMEFKTQ